MVTDAHMHTHSHTHAHTHAHTQTCTHAHTYTQACTNTQFCMFTINKSKFNVTVAITGHPVEAYKNDQNTQKQKQNGSLGAFV